ncbi:MAG: efflux RND transporter permease subunit, partial [Desulfarculus sp.]|nr:efflux RND transporter permease subunit [Desulfarculus sp.]
MNRLTALVLSRPLGSLAACLGLAVLGLVAAAGLNLNLLPSTRYPALTVSTSLPDAGPQEVETLITRPLEDDLRAVVGARKIYSRSRQGRSEVTLELNPEADVSAAAQDLRGRLRRQKPNLPFDTRPPVISQYSPSEQPAAVLGVTGSLSLAQAGDWARQVLAPRLRRVEGLAEVQISGAPEPEIQVECDPQRLKALGLSVRQVALAVKQGSLDLPAGVLAHGLFRVPLKVAGGVKTAPEVAALPIGEHPGGGLLTVGQVALVRASQRPAEEITRLGGRQVVTLALYQASGANLGRLWGQAEEVLAQTPPPGQDSRPEVVYSQAQLVSQALERLAWMALIAALAAAGVLYLFLRDLASTLAACAALPFSRAVALLLVRLAGLELDIISLA